MTDLWGSLIAGLGQYRDPNYLPAGSLLGFGQDQTGTIQPGPGGMSWHTFLRLQGLDPSYRGRGYSFRDYDVGSRLPVRQLPGVYNPANDQ